VPELQKKSGFLAIYGGWAASLPAANSLKRKTFSADVEGARGAMKAVDSGSLTLGGERCTA
jgi:hypothetical protein